MTLGDDRLEIGDGVKSGVVHVWHGGQHAPHGVIDIEVAAFEEAVGVVELTVDDQRPGLQRFQCACLISASLNCCSAHRNAVAFATSPDRSLNRSISAMTLRRRRCISPSSRA